MAIASYTLISVKTLGSGDGGGGGEYRQGI